MQYVTASIVLASAHGPLELDIAALQFVAGGLPKGTWSDSTTEGLPKGTWSESLPKGTWSESLPKGTW